MQEDLTLLSYIFKVSAWFEQNRKMATWVVGAVVAVACVIGYSSWSRTQREEKAGAMLSQVAVSTLLGHPDAKAPAADYLRVASEYHGTSAASLALLQAGTISFRAAKFDDAQQLFQRMLHDYPGSSYAPQASLGVAACLDAQGKTDEAIQAYKNTVDRYPESIVVAQAKFSLARLFEGQKKYPDAFKLYEDVARMMGFNSSLGSEAAIRSVELRRLYAPAVTPGGPAPAPTAPVNVFTNLLSTRTNTP